ncbi:hypothetical protein SRA_05671 [Streptococcus ratti FA-1 = DSM 20564]|uniref:Uncharacterized protein n=1 Tax=Streptococcus ratti FA-1 = DSM 20564 TaxID=699248 RepID=A0ABP2QYN2_STRRT|nr:hypothetical protein SRA_05671 [Streptococcus ratti FA-1 = DSM 20564]
MLNLSGKRTEDKQIFSVFLMALLITRSRKLSSGSFFFL